MPGYWGVGGVHGPSGNIKKCEETGLQARSLHSAIFQAETINRKSDLKSAFT
jgi:hypothetical protein